MGVKIKLGFDGYLAVRDSLGRDLYRKDIQSKQEIKPWMKANKPSARGWGILNSSFVPVRVDNLVDLRKDLFLPTFVNHVCKIQDIFLKILATLFAIPWDLLTLPIRCFTLPLRWAQHHYGPKNASALPVIDLIKKSPHFAEAMKNGSVHLVARTSDIKVTQTLGELCPTAKRWLSQWTTYPTMAQGSIYKKFRLVNLKPLPWSEGKKRWKNLTVEYTRDLATDTWKRGMKTDFRSERSLLEG